MTTLRVDSVDYVVEDTQILSDVSLHVEDGEFVALVGPNGSGKSTTLSCTAGLLTPTSGSISLSNENIAKLNRTAIARRLAVIGQSMPVNFDFSVREIVEMGRAPHKGLFDTQNEEDRRIVEDALEDVGMKDFADRAYGTLSGGEKQRVLIARCLAQQADILLLDEPTNHLDVRYTLDFLDLIHDFEGSVLIAMHNLNRAAQYSDRVVVLEDGTVQHVGSPGDVLTVERIESVFGRSARVDQDPDTDRPRITFEPGVDRD